MQDYPNLPVVFDTLLGVSFTLLFMWAVLGTLYRMASWLRTPSPLPIPLTPAPRSRAGVVGRLCLEVFIFRALARANKPTWVASILFHYGLLFILIMHMRFFYAYLPGWLIPFVVWSGWAAAAAVVGLCVLLLRRIIVDRVRYISSPSDYLHLVLLLSIVFSGYALKRFWPVNTSTVGEFLRGALSFQWQPLPDSAVLVIHLVCVLLLFFVFPISKLLHGAGIVFSPTLNQRENIAGSSSSKNGEPSS